MDRLATETLINRCEPDRNTAKVCITISELTQKILNKIIKRNESLRGIIDNKIDRQPTVSSDNVQPTARASNVLSGIIEDLESMEKCLDHMEDNLFTKLSNELDRL